MEDEQKPSYSKVALSNRITDFPKSDKNQVPSPNEDKTSQDSKFDTLLTAIQSINDQLNTSESKVQNQL